MGVPLLDSLNYNIFNVSTLPHNSLQTPPEDSSNQRENARILSTRVENIGDIFSQSQNRCRSDCVAPVLYIAPEEIVQRTEIGLYGRRPAPALLFLSKKPFEMTHFLKWISTKSKLRSVVCLSPILLKPKFRKIFHRCELREGLFFQYLTINWIVNIFRNENRTNKPLHTECRPHCDFLWMQVLCKKHAGIWTHPYAAVM